MRKYLSSLHPLRKSKITIKSDSLDKISAYRFNGIDYVEKLEIKEDDGKSIVEASDSGYYIIASQKKINVFYKGSLDYKIFILNILQTDEDTIDVNIDDGIISRTEQAKRLIDNIYIYTPSNNEFGILTANNSKSYAIINQNKIKKKVQKNVSQLNSSKVQANKTSNRVNRENTSNNVEKNKSKSNSKHTVVSTSVQSTVVSSTTTK